MQFLKIVQILVIYVNVNKLLNKLMQKFTDKKNITV